MKHLLVTTVFAFFVIVALGQEVSKQVQWRLNPILNSVEVNQREKKELIAAIEKFQKNVREIRKTDNENKQAELKRNSQQYLEEVKNVLGAKRFRKWRQDIRKQRKSSY